MRACSKCGTSNADHANFCQACRSPLQAMDSNGQSSGRTVKGNGKFCNSCGSTVMPQDKFCDKCGNQLMGTTIGATTVGKETRQVNNVQSDELVYFVGQNQTYYLQKWMTSFDPEKRSGWNWVAFFFAPIWFAYRKMYMYAIIFFLLQSIVSAYSYGITGLATAIIGGLLGNAFYYKHAKQKIQEIMMTTDNIEMRKMKLTQEGGTSKVAMILFIILTIAWGSMTTI